MAYSQTTFQRMSGAGPLQFYSYITPDTQAVVSASGYFNNATSQIFQNDVIFVVGDTGTARTLKHYVVTSASGAAVVTLTAGT